MKKYRVVYQKIENRYRVTGAIFIEADHEKDALDKFPSELKARSIFDIQGYQIINVQTQQDIKTKEQSRKRNLTPVELPIRLLKLMLDYEERGFRCSCSNLRHFVKMKLYQGACYDQHLFLCNYCERVYSVREKAVSFILKNTEIDFANKLDWLLPAKSSVMKDLAQQC